MPSLCMWCREDEEDHTKERFKSARERMEKEKSVLLGLKSFLPGIFGVLPISNVESIEERIEEVERRYWREIAMEESEAREEW